MIGGRDHEAKRETGTTGLKRYAKRLGIARISQQLYPRVESTKERAR